MWESLRVAGPVIIFVGLIVWFYSQHTRTTAAAEAYATSRGWTFDSNVRGLDRHYPTSFPFAVGGGRMSTNVLRHSGADARGDSFDYSFTTQRGRHRTRHHYHVVSIRLPKELPLVAVRPEQVTDSIEKFFGAQDIQFESAEFNRAWLATGTSLAAAHDIIHPRTMNWLMQRAVRDLNFTIGNGYLYMAIKGPQKLNQIDWMIETLRAYRAQIPGFVWEKTYSEDR